MPEHLDELTKEYESLQNQKSHKSGGVEARVLTNIAMYAGEQWVYHSNRRLLTDKARRRQPHIILNKIRPRVRKSIGRMLSVFPNFEARPDADDPDKIAKAEEVNKLIPALGEKVDDDEKNWKLWWWLHVGGVAFEYTAYRPNVTVEPMPVLDDEGEILWEDNETGDRLSTIERQLLIQQGFPAERFDIAEDLQLTGDVHSEVLGPLNVFLPLSAASVDDLGPDQSVMVAKIRTRAWIEENYPDADLSEVEFDDEFSIVKTDVSKAASAFNNHSLKDLIPVIQGAKDDADPDMAVVVERFQPVSELFPKGWAVQAAAEGQDVHVPLVEATDEAGEPIFDESGDPVLVPDTENLFGGRYTVFIPKKGVLHDGELPYEDGIPLVDFHWEPTTTIFFNDAYVDDLVLPQKTINEWASGMLKHVRTWSQQKVLLDESLSEDDFLADEPHFVKPGLGPEGQPLAAPMQTPELSRSLVAGLEFMQSAFNDQAGAADLFQEFRFPGQIRGTLAFPLLQEILDSEHGPVIKHFYKRKARVHQQRINRVKQFYPPKRTLNYTSQRDTDEVLVFHTDEILRAGAEFSITVQPSSLTPELSAMREERIRSRLEGPLAVLYQDQRTGHPDVEKIAQDLKWGPVAQESRLLRARKFAKKVVSMIVKGEENVPPPMPFTSHEVMLDEIDLVMEDTDFFKMSEETQQRLFERRQQHAEMLSEQMEQQRATAIDEETMDIIRQAVQQSVARALSQQLETLMQGGAMQQQPPSMEQLLQARDPGVL